MSAALIALRNRLVRGNALSQLGNVRRGFGGC